MLAQTFKNELKKKKKMNSKIFLENQKEGIEKKKKNQQNWAWLFSPLKKATYAYKKAT